jgi:glucuronosyltransferase
MTFFQRVKNALGTIALSGVFRFYYNPIMEKIYRAHFGQDTPGVEEIKYNVSLILANGHFSLNFPRPLMPEVIDVGGMHCRPANPLPKDLDDFLSGSGEDGFILFSLGSIVKAHEMPDRIRQMFLNVFSKLKQRVIWKWETGTMEGLPKNVKLGKWLPQQDILGHPKIKMFITHGGLLSTEEAVYHGVPLIGFPMFGDQDWNIKQAENLGFALGIDISEMTEDMLLDSINRILHEPKFAQTAKDFSSRFKDRPQKPLDTAVYWTEYIIRHKGAPHMRSAGRDLNFFQYHSFDVIAFLLVSAMLTLYVPFAILRFLYRKCCGKSSARTGKVRPKRD